MSENKSLPSAEARRIDYGSMWGFMRSVLTQGAAIYQDFAAGNLKDYEEYSARVDAAARERDDELKSLPSATAATIPDDVFVPLLTVLMEADPWPFSVNRDPIEDFANEQSRLRGHDDWIAAWHTT